MTRVLEATATADGKVMVGSIEVPTAEILSEGEQASEGLLFLDGLKAYYLPSSAVDIKVTIEKVCNAIEDVASALATTATTLTSIGAGMTGPTTAPPAGLAASVTAINAKVTELATTRTELLTLKEALR